MSDLSSKLITADQLDTPVLFIIFNRPDTAVQAFERIKAVRPRRLFIAADGPRPEKPGEADLCQQTRDAITQMIDWECHVQTLFRGENLGCRRAVSGAIDWFFENVEAGIILEDDCVADPSFFTFCQELLNYYDADDRVMMISGDNFQGGIKRGDASYYFTRFPHIWGWASWRRAWEKYDVNMGSFSEFKRQNVIADTLTNPAAQQFWLQNFKLVAEKGLDTWDFQWVYAVLCNNGMCIMPNENLVSNIGFNEQATHTKTIDKFSELGTGKITEIKHPEFLAINEDADNYTLEHVFGVDLNSSVPEQNLWQKLSSILK